MDEHVNYDGTVAYELRGTHLFGSKIFQKIGTFHVLNTGKDQREQLRDFMDQMKSQVKGPISLVIPSLLPDIDTSKSYLIV